MIGESPSEAPARAEAVAPAASPPLVSPADAGQAEIGGRGGPDPTRYGDWEKNGRCIDF